jgi:small subunit ribosomal protein S16
VGFYNPMAHANEEGLRVVFDRVTYWKSVGAQASPTVERLLGQAAKKVAAAPAAA